MVRLGGIKRKIMNGASFMVRLFGTSRHLDTGLHARVYDKAEASMAWKWSGEISSEKNFKYRVESMRSSLLKGSIHRSSLMDISINANYLKRGRLMDHAPVCSVLGIGRETAHPCLLCAWDPVQASLAYVR